MYERKKKIIYNVYLFINLYYIDSYIVWLYKLRQTLQNIIYK